jgi:hypothetical protein
MRRVATILLAIGLLTILVTVTTMLLSEEPEHNHSAELAHHQNAGQPDIFKDAEPAGAEEEEAFFPMKLHKLGGFTIILGALFHVFYNRKTLMRNFGLRKRETLDAEKS